MKKKIITILFSAMLIASMAISVNAATPSLNTPATPTIPDISGSVEIELPDDYFDDYFEDHPIEIAPEPEEEEVPSTPVWSWKTFITKIIAYFKR